MAGNAFLEAIERTVRERPDASAFEADGRRVTYAHLWEVSDAIAAELSSGIEGREPVVVFGHKDFLTVAGFLGCLKSGHAYVPVDVELPASRIADILSQLASPAVVAAAPLSSALGPYVASDRVLDISSADGLAAISGHGPKAAAPAREAWVTGEETQYIIFTSGSTGKPKGIEVSANNVAHFMEWVRTFPVVRDGGRVFLDQPPYSFDLSEYEVVGALSTGGELHAVSRALTSDTRALFDDLRASGIEVWVSTPSFADLCLVDKGFDEGLLPDVRLFLFCGEALGRTTAAELRRRFPNAIVANTYGPTESTVAVTYCEIGEADIESESPLPAGKPRPGTEIHICDPDTGEPLPCGQTGEIVICGDTVAKGYYRNPEKTAAAFGGATLSDGRAVRSYRTGDAGYLDERGTVHCEGRFDSLVKLNGFRIELGDVEENIRALSGVKGACVVPVSHKGRIAYLKAFVALEPHPDAGDGSDGNAGVEHPTHLDIERGLKARLAQRIPAYMVPRRFVLRDELPLTPNGKVDRRALAQQA